MIYTSVFMDNDEAQFGIGKAVGAHFYQDYDPKNPHNKVLKVCTHNTVTVLNSTTNIYGKQTVSEPSAAEFDFSYFFETIYWTYASKYFTLEFRTKSNAKVFALRFELLDYVNGNCEARKICVKDEDGVIIGGVTLHSECWNRLRVRYYFGAGRDGEARVRIYHAEGDGKLTMAADVSAPKPQGSVCKAAIVHSATKIKGISYFDNISFTLTDAKYSPNTAADLSDVSRKVYDFESGIPSTPDFNIEMLLKKGDERASFDPASWSLGPDGTPFKSAHNFAEIMLVLEGEGLFTAAGKEFPFSAGSIIITAPGCKHSFSTSLGYKILSVAGNFEKLSFITDATVLKDNIYNEGRKLAELILYNRFGNEDYVDRLCDAYIKYILLNLDYTFKNTTASIYKIISKMEKNFGNCDLSIGKLLDESGYARDYIRAEFLEVTKMTPKKYLTNIRMKNAKAMIELYGKDMSMGEIAEKCGIIDQSIFSRIFKKHFGFSPTQHRMNVFDGV